METFTDLKEFVKNPNYLEQRENSLHNIADGTIDTPIINTINAINTLPYCFTLQSCYGHFVHEGNNNAYNFEPLPTTDVSYEVEYRIAYIAFCIENSKLGKELFGLLKKIPETDPHNIQFCCAEWFWSNQVNSYVLQVEPERYKHKDKVILGFQEAYTIEKVRNRFFIALNKLFEIN